MTANHEKRRLALVSAGLPNAALTVRKIAKYDFRTGTVAVVRDFVCEAGYWPEIIFVF
jgi:hypothetical protein